MKLSALLKVLPFILMMALVAAPPVSADEHQADTEAAEAAALAWLGLIDRGEYGPSWDQAAEYFRRAVPKDQWTQTLTAVREPLGDLVSRKLSRAQYADSLPGAPDGRYVVLTFSASFSNKKNGRGNGDAHVGQRRNLAGFGVLHQMTSGSLEDLVGRLFLIGFEGEEFDSDLEQLLLEIRPAGIILFKRNVGGGPFQTARLVAACQGLARQTFGRPLLTAIDQEGGSVRRLGPPFSQLPGQRDQAEKLTASGVRSLAEAGAAELAAVGLNFNLTPVLDLCTDPRATYMASRSFGADPDLAARLGLAVIQGHQEKGVLTCAKHFPGIGDTRLDPHQDLPSVDHPAERLKKKELAPFARAVEAGVAGVMTSHVIYPRVDPRIPATFSEKITTGWLRNELGHQGLILGDDLEMGAIIKHYQVGPAAVLSLKAGHDLILVCRRAELIREAHQAVLKAARDGEITTARLEQSAARLENTLARLDPANAPNPEEVFNHDR